MFIIDTLFYYMYAVLAVTKINLNVFLIYAILQKGKKKSIYEFLQTKHKNYFLKYKFCLNCITYKKNFEENNSIQM